MVLGSLSWSPWLVCVIHTRAAQREHLLRPIYVWI